MIKKMELSDDEGRVDLVVDGAKVVVGMHKARLYVKIGTSLVHMDRTDTIGVCAFILTAMRQQEAQPSDTET